MYIEVMRSLSDARGNWPGVARASGVPYTYIKQLMSGRIKNPGVQQMELLYTYFANEKLAANRIVEEARG